METTVDPDAEAYKLLRAHAEKSGVDLSTAVNEMVRRAQRMIEADWERLTRREDEAS